MAAGHVGRHQFGADPATTERQGPVIAASGRFVQTSVAASVEDLLEGRPVAARACDPTPLALPAGSASGEIGRAHV